jgi:protocatechuate 3,4-dioxygenase beta subunit
MTDKSPHEHGLADFLLRWEAQPSDRRDVLRLLAGAALLPIFGCSSTVDSTSSSGGASSSTSSGGASSSSGGSSTSSGSSGAAATCKEIPAETGGPYPGDGTNGPNVLTESGIMRSNIRSSYGTMSGTAAGVALKVTLKVVNTSGGCAPLAGYLVYLWHCDNAGKYSLYTVATENYLRGAQLTDANGEVTFETTFPGCYDGRWPHIHFEIFSSMTAATGRTALKTSQLALPKDTCSLVYATPGYEASIGNLAKTSLTGDMVFKDGSTEQVPLVSGDVAGGFSATLVVGVKGT